MKRILMIPLAAALAACQGMPVDANSAATAGQPASIVAASAGVSGAASGSGHTLYDFGVPLPYGLGLRNFTFNAIHHADGRVEGQWQIVVGGTILHGDIDCLTIAPDGASARMSGVITSSKFTTLQAGTAFAMEIFDNGNGASGAADVTTQLLAFRNADPSVGRAFCTDGTVPTGADLSPLPIDHGNFSIRTDR